MNILTRIRRWLAPLVFEDEDKTRIAGLLNVILSAVFVIALLLTLATGVLPGSEPNALSRMAVGVATAILALVGWLIMRRGHVRLASVLLSSMLLVNATIVVYFVGTIRAPITTVYIVCIVITSLLIGSRAAIVFSALSLLALLGLFQAEVSGLLPPPQMSSGINNWVTHAATLSMTAVLLNLASRSINDALERARRNERALYKSNRELQAEIAERLRVEQALREGEEKLKKAQEMGRVGSWEWDLISNKVTWSDELFKILGFEPDEVKPNFDLWSEMIHPSDIEKSNEFAEKTMQGDTEVTTEYRMVIKDKSIRHIFAKGQGQFDDKNKPVKMRGIVQDITDRKRVEEALRESTEKISAMFESMTDGITFTDLQGNIIDLNEATLRLHGFESKEEVIGQSSLTFFAEGERDRAVKNLQKTLATGRSGVFEHRLLTKCGQVFDGELNAVLLKDDQGNPSGFVALSRDITERKRAEEQIKAALAEKEVLLREIHHRVKNNLAIIFSLLGFQAEIIEDEEVRAALRESQNRINSMARIHEHLYRSQDLAWIEMPGYIQGLVNYLRQSYGRHEIAVKIDASDVVLDIDTAVPCGLIINELVSNALEHAFEDGKPGEIYISMRSLGSVVELNVSDNGIGLQDHVNLQNLESLGLRLVDLLAHQLEGTLDVDNSEGTTFKLTFATPVERGSEAGLQGRSSQE